ncbi:helix-turn-helix domain-containing protein [Paenibacillus allorhizosphaerae]|nr:helix-turn-helix transcriptional regulator [Paenibacillus allorhizosphaerae]
MLGKRVRQLRMERGLSLSALAEAADVAKSYLSTIERDIHSNPSVHVMDKIAAALDVPLEQLLHPEPRDAELQWKQEWIELLHDALRSGVAPDELRSMIEFKKWQSCQSEKEEE